MAKQSAGEDREEHLDLVSLEEPWFPKTDGSEERLELLGRGADRLERADGDTSQGL